MTLHGIMILDLIGLVLGLFILNEVRRDRLYVGYGVIFIVSIGVACVLLSVPPLLVAVTRLVGAVYPASALALLAFCFIAFMLVYVLTQVTILSNRLACLVQELAITQAKLDQEMRRRQGSPRDQCET